MVFLSQYAILMSQNVLFWPPGRGMELSKCYRALQFPGSVNPSRAFYPLLPVFNRAGLPGQNVFILNTRKAAFDLHHQPPLLFSKFLGSRCSSVATTVMKDNADMSPLPALSPEMR
jgi:hypothetical protein